MPAKQKPARSKRHPRIRKALDDVDQLQKSYRDPWKTKLQLRWTVTLLAYWHDGELFYQRARDQKAAEVFLVRTDHSVPARTT